jgi:hypothetical protein
MALSFDEASPGRFYDGAGNYKLNVSPELRAADWRWARAGSGAALFSGAGNSGEPLLVEVKNKNALFAPNARIGDFSIEFWLYPFNLENGEQILSWVSSTSKNFQRVQCVAEKNRLRWSFVDFFASADGARRLDIHLSGDSPVVPKAWSHHLVRFDSGTGMIDYEVDGKIQAIVYSTASGHEGGEVYNPLTGEGGCFSRGSRFSGLIDEFKIHGLSLERPSLHKYPAAGRMETRPIDLGEVNSRVIKVDARGGRAASGTRGSAEYRRNGRFRFDDASEMQFWIRTAENPYHWDNSPWFTFTPGAELPDTCGRYVQLAVDFYPSADGLASPYLEDIQIPYIPALPPLPPSSLTAVASDAGVLLRWKNSPDIETVGYLVYYGTEKDQYFCKDALAGASPIDAGMQNSLLIEGLQNGVLYYFRVAAYGRRRPGDFQAFHAGEFSREVSARPLKGLGL